VRQASKDIAEIIKRIDAPATAGFDDGVKDSGTFACLGIPEEEPVLFLMESFP